MKALNKGLLCVFAAIGVMALTACIGSGSGTESGTEVVIEPPSAPVDPDTFSCNPSDGQTAPAPRTQGIRGQLYYLDSTQPQYGAVSDYFTYGHLVENVYLFFDRIFVPTRPFDRGFQLASGDIIQTQEGDTLYEYFAIRHEGRLQLANKPEGDYQLALLSDDGSVLSMDFGSGLEPVINNDGNHPTKMKCAMIPLSMASVDKIPFQLDYYQGPRYHISLIWMWRPWPADPADPLCDTLGNSHFFDSTQDPPAPTANYQALLDRGWQPIEAENYLLPEEQESNPCNEPAPVISNFRTMSISTNYILVSWETDRPATSQVSFYPVNGAVSLTDGDGQYRTSHTVQVSGLTANTEYRLKAVSASSSGLSSESAELAVRTRR